MRKSMAKVIATCVTLCICGVLCAFGESKALVAYFSQTGNTRMAAKIVATEIGADLVEILPVEPYPTDIGECCRVVKPQCDAKATPEIRPLAICLADYDRIIVCSPNWFQTIAPPVRTFLARNTFAGKRLHLLLTHGSGAGKEKCVSDFAALAKIRGAAVGEAKTLPGKKVKEETESLRSFATDVAGPEVRVRKTPGGAQLFVDGKAAPPRMLWVRPYHKPGDGGEFWEQRAYRHSVSQVARAAIER